MNISSTEIDTILKLIWEKNDIDNFNLDKKECQFSMEKKLNELPHTHTDQISNEN